MNKDQIIKMLRNTYQCTEVRYSGNSKTFYVTKATKKGSGKFSEARKIVEREGYKLERIMPLEAIKEQLEKMGAENIVVDKRAKKITVQGMIKQAEGLLGQLRSRVDYRIEQRKAEKYGRTKAEKVAKLKALRANYPNLKFEDFKDEETKVVSEG